jgi:hypothetical protein
MPVLRFQAYGGNKVKERQLQASLSHTTGFWFLLSASCPGRSSLITGRVAVYDVIHPGTPPQQHILT